MKRSHLYSVEAVPVGLTGSRLYQLSLLIILLHFNGLASRSKMSENDHNRMLIIQEPATASSECEYSEHHNLVDNKVILDLDRNHQSESLNPYHHHPGTFEYFIRDPNLNYSFQVNIPHTVANWPTNIDMETTPPRYIAQYPSAAEVNITREDNPAWRERSMQLEKGIDFCSQ